MSLARVYEYGLLPPIENADLVLDQMVKVHRYKNRLTEIERARRAEVARVMTSHADVSPLQAAVDDLDREIEAARTAIRTMNAKERKRVDRPDERARIRELAAILREKRAQLREAKRLIRDDEQVKRGIAAAEDRSRSRIRYARSRCGAYWASYLLAESSADQARKSITPPNFYPWTGDGRVAVQMQGGIALEELWGGDTRIQIDEVNPIAYEPETTRGQWRRMTRTRLRMRVSSTDKGRPIWAEWPMIMHRPLPPGCRIKHATVHRRRRDCRAWSWTVTIQVELPDGWTKGKPGHGAVALNLGYTQMYPHLDGAIRSGFLVGDDGQTREIIVKRSVIDRVQKAESLRSFRDRDLDVMKPLLVAWMREHEHELPTWFQDRTIWSRPPRVSEPLDPVDPQTESEQPAALEAGHSPSNASKEQPAALVAGLLAQAGPGALAQEPADELGRKRVWHIAQWKSPARFRELCFAWRASRWEGDEEGHRILEAWRYRDEHLERYETNMAAHALRDRRETYRIIAADLARTYATLVVHDTDLREMQKSPKPESDKAEIPTVKRNQRFAAGSILRSTLENAFRRCGGTIIVVSDDGITKMCHVCKKNCTWDRSLSRAHTCEHCGATWDQDENACRNMIDRHYVEVEMAKLHGDRAVERKESRSERLRRSKLQKKALVTAQEETARNSP